MARDSRYDILFEPVTVGPKTLKNRFYQTPHCTSFGVQYPETQAHFRGMKAEGGWAAVNIEFCSISPTTDFHPRQSACLWDLDDMRNLSHACDKIHEHGALAGVELWYGSGTRNLESRLPARGVSQTVSNFYWDQCCYTMSIEEIHEVQAWYRLGALRALESGFDLINVWGSQGLAITQDFLMPYSNRRTDAYGGSFDNRARFWRECIETVRDAVGQKCAVVVRLCIESLHPDGRGVRLEEEAIPFIELVDDVVDLWDLDVGSSISANISVGSSAFFPENWQKSWVERVRPHTRKPIVGVGRFTNPDTMVDVVRSGQLDVIGAARPSIADPFLPRKLEEGRLDDIRECIGSNGCVARFSLGARLTCTQNATAGEEYRRGWHPEEFTKAANAASDVLVVGAGAAGMECAMILGKRGMRRVHLVDSEAEMGGALRFIALLPGLGEWTRLVNYRRIQIDKLPNVEFIPNAHLTADDVLGYGADIVVIATGATWVRDGFSGQTQNVIIGADAEAPFCLTPDQVLAENKPVPGNRVLIYDCDGYYMGVSLAMRLATEGKTVALVTPFSQIAPYTIYTQEFGFYNRRIYELGVAAFAERLIDRIDYPVVHGTHVWSGQTETWKADAIILVTQRRSSDALYHQLKADETRLAREGIANLHRIGDCVAPRLLADVIFDGHRLAREIDSDDPSRAKVFLRENRVVAGTLREGGWTAAVE